MKHYFGAFMLNVLDTYSVNVKTNIVITHRSNIEAVLAFNNLATLR